MSTITAGRNKFAADMFDHQGRMRVIPEEDGWSVYVAFAKDGAVKVGVTHRPMLRMCEIHKTRPIKQYLRAPASSKSNAYSIEAALKRAFAARHIEGEWFRFDYQQAADKAEFHDITKAVYRAIEQRDLTWSRGDMAKVAAYLAMDAELARDARRKPRRWRLS